MGGTLTAAVASFLAREFEGAALLDGLSAKNLNLKGI
jgi:hypothetical protein